MLDADIRRFIEAPEACQHEFQGLLTSATDLLSQALRHLQQDSTHLTFAEVQRIAPELGVAVLGPPFYQASSTLAQGAGEGSAPPCGISRTPATMRDPLTMSANVHSDAFPVTPSKTTMLMISSRVVISSTNLDDLLHSSYTSLTGNAEHCTWINRHRIWPSTVFDEATHNDVVCTWFPRQDKGQDDGKICHLFPFFKDQRWRSALFNTSQRTFHCFADAHAPRCTNVAHNSGSSAKSE